MKPALSTLLVSLAVLGVLTGSLLRPCDCGEDDAGSLCAVSHARGVGTGDGARRGCCGGCVDRAVEDVEETGGNSGQRDFGQGDSGHGDCGLCCKPAPAGIEAPPAVSLELPALWISSATGFEPLDAGVEPVGRPRGDGGPPDRAPWLLSEEGLTVFLI